MAGFCITTKTEKIKYNVCNDKGIFEYSCKQPFAIPENLYGYVIGYETEDKDLPKIKLMSPYNYDESMRGKVIPVRAIVRISHINKNNKARFEAETDEMFEERIKEAGDIALTEGEQIAKNCNKNGVMAEMIYLDSLPDDKAELQKMYEVIEIVRLNRLFSMNGFSLPYIDNGDKGLSSVSLKKYIKLIKDQNYYWYEDLERIETLIGKVYKIKSFDIWTGFEILLKIVESYYNEENGVHVWKKKIEKKLES